MAFMILKDLNDDTKLKIENRSDKKGICPAPRFADGSVCTDVNVIDLVTEIDAVTGSEIVKAVINEDKVAAAASAKLQNERNAKLEQLRASRNEALKKIDIMATEFSLGLRSDKDVIIQKRQRLLDLPSSYHWQSDKQKAKVIIDDIAIADVVEAALNG